MLQKLVEAYKFWHKCAPHIPKTARYTLGGKIDELFTQVIEAVAVASFTPQEKKLPYIQRAIIKLDVLKFFLRVAWEIRALANKKYITLSERLDPVGRMLGGWRKKTQEENSPRTKRGEK